MISLELFDSASSERAAKTWSEQLDNLSSALYIHIVNSRTNEVMTLTQELVPEVQDFLKALASQTRQRILLLFADGRERTVGQVAEEAGVGQSTASEHLSILRRGGLLRARREQKEVYYAPDGARIRRHLTTLSNLLLRCCPPDR